MEETILELLKQEGTGAAGAILGWTVLGIILGVIAAVTGFFIIRAVGGYRSTAKWGRGLRVLTFIALLISMPILGGTIAFHQSIWRTINHLVHESEVVRDALPQLGTAAADLVGVIYLIGREVADGRDPSGQDFGPELEAFRNGDWELDADGFLQAALDLRERVTDELLVDLKSDLRAQSPELKEGIGGALLDWLVDTHGPEMLEKLALKEADRIGVKGPAIAILAGLREAARESGSPESISHAELSIYLVRQVLDAGVLKPTRVYVRGQQVMAWIFVAIFLGVLVIVFKLAGRGSQQRDRADQSGPSESSCAG